jgi:predicted nucleic acid-binding protein
MNEPRAVLDTNVLLDLWVFDDPGVASLRAALAAGVLIAQRSPATDAELADVLARPQFGLSRNLQQALRTRWNDLAQPIERVFPAPWQCADPHDQPFLDLAFTARAQWLLTKDKALLRLARRALASGLSIVAPARCVARRLVTV